MKLTKRKINNIDDYISAFPPETQKILEQIRATIKKAAPGSVETIKYSMPTFTLKGNLIHFAAYKNHIGLYPAPTGDESLTKELSVFKAEKSTLRFPIDKPVPYELISRIVKLRVRQQDGT
jgi:uncharacterized protein YdhG (YjbR/CyaY superfamily)